MWSAFDIATLKDVKDSRAWQDSNLQSPDPKSGALSIRPHTLSLHRKITHMCILFTEGNEKHKNMSTAPSIPRRSPIQVLTWPDGA